KQRGDGQCAKVWREQIKTVKTKKRINAILLAATVHMKRMILNLPASTVRSMMRPSVNTGNARKTGQRDCPHMKMNVLSAVTTVMWMKIVSVGDPAGMLMQALIPGRRRIQ